MGFSSSVMRSFLEPVVPPLFFFEQLNFLTYEYIEIISGRYINDGLNKNNGKWIRKGAK